MWLHRSQNGRLTGMRAHDPCMPACLQIHPQHHAMYDLGMQRHVRQSSRQKSNEESWLTWLRQCIGSCIAHRGGRRGCRLPAKALPAIEQDTGISRPNSIWQGTAGNWPRSAAKSPACGRRGSVEGAKILSSYNLSGRKLVPA